MPRPPYLGWTIPWMYERAFRASAPEPIPSPHAQRSAYRSCSRRLLPVAGFGHAPSASLGGSTLAPAPDARMAREARKPHRVTLLRSKALAHLADSSSRRADAGAAAGGLASTIAIEPAEEIDASEYRRRNDA